jgi:hypothetical protein
MDFRSRQQLTRALEPLKQALEAHRRSLVVLDRTLMEFEETLNQPEKRPGRRPQVQQTSSSIKESGQCRLTVV